MKHPVRIVVAVGPDNGIGYKGGLPWPQLPLDLHMFRQVTTSTQDPLCRNAIVMGRVTWTSLRHRALPNRLNVIVSSSDLSSPKRIGSALNISEDQRAQVHVARSFRDALQWLDSKDDIETVYAIGGVAIYAEAMALDACDKLYVTHVRKQFTSDRFLPPIDATRWRVTSSRRREDAGGIEIDVNVYERVVAPLSPPLVHEEQQYLDLIREVMRDGISRGDRTGVGTRSVFGRCMRFDLRQHFPLLTTKRVFWRGVVEELLWFMRGETDARLLSEKGVKIWDQNASKEFLASVGLGHREAGDLGPVYGWQWRHFGATYVDCKTDYTGKGVDQLAAVLDALRNKPNDRRIILSAWNPKDISSMALPPCHLLAQFFVANGELTCLMYQRSADLGLGVPFNIASYALLTRILAHLSGLRAREFVHVLGDAHVYNNHDAPLRAQLENAPRPFPRLNILAAPTTTLEALRFEDFQLEGYEPHASIKMDMAV